VPGHAEQNVKGRWGSGVKNVKIDNNLVLHLIGNLWLKCASSGLPQESEVSI